MGLISYSLELKENYGTKRNALLQNCQKCMIQLSHSAFEGKLFKSSLCVTFDTREYLMMQLWLGYFFLLSTQIALCLEIKNVEAILLVVNELEKSWLETVRIPFGPGSWHLPLDCIPPCVNTHHNVILKQKRTFFYLLNRNMKRNCFFTIMVCSIF